MNTHSAFTAWAEKHGVQMTPSAGFDYRAALGAEQCDQAAAVLLAMAHETTALLQAGAVADRDLDIAHADLLDKLFWALRYLGIALDSYPDYRAAVRVRYLPEPGPEDCGMGCAICAGVPDNDPGPV